MKEIEYNNYNFDMEKIVFHLNRITDYREKAKYLENVLYDISVELNKVKEDIPSYSSGTLGNEVEKRIGGLGKVKVILELEVDKLKGSETNHVKESDFFDDPVNKIFIKSSVSDVVRIFESMKHSGIISSDKTESWQIAQIFFGDSVDSQKFVSNYNSIKRKIYDFERNSNSTELAEFIKHIIEISFKKKDPVLEDIIKHIERLQKNII